MGEPVTVAIPVRNGARFLADVLTAVKGQQLDRTVEILVADSGSTDGSRELAKREDAEVIDVEPQRFSHGGTRRLLARRAAGAHIAFLTQDAVPEHDGWLANLLAGFQMAADVALVFGPYRPRPESSHMVRRELDEWFRSLSPDGAARLERGLPGEGDPDAIRRSFFTDANACVARAALDRVPFREVSYAEDQLLARDMLRAGYAKVYRPDAAVVHSHDYVARQIFQRSFDEWRGLREVYGTIAAPGLARSALGVQREVRDDVHYLRGRGDGGLRLMGDLLASTTYHSARAAGAMLGARADSLPTRARALCSLEGRSTFEPVDS